MLYLVLLILVVLLFIGFPMMVGLASTSFFLLWNKLPFLNPVFFVQQIIGSVEPYVLLCIPMFIFAAEIMSRGESADRLVDLVKAFVGHISGGLAMTTAGACTLFGAISGSTQATVAAIGPPMNRKLLEGGYDESSNMALIINSSDIAILIPPSSVMILYAVVTGTSIAELFIAGIIPGVIICILFCIYNFTWAKIKKMPVSARSSWPERSVAIKKASLSLGFPIIIMGGIYTGVFSPTEAAATAVLYALVVEVLIYRSVKFSEIPDLALNTGMITAVVFILVGIGGGFSVMLSYARIPQLISEAALGIDPSALKILVVVSIFYFVGCMFVDSLVIILIATPIFFPVAVKAGIDPVLLGIVVTLQAAIGTATPPFGCDIFTAIAVFDKPYFTVVRKTPPYIIMLVMVSVMMIAFPEIALFTRNLVFR